MTKLKQISKELKKVKALKAYNHIFKHKQMKYASSKALLIFNPKASIKILVSMEYKLMKEKKDKKMFINNMKVLSKNTNGNIDWKVFGEFLWYLFQTSTYYKDIKLNIKNIYSKDNFIEINSKKRDVYQKWIDSLDKKDPHYNTKIRQILKELT